MEVKINRDILEYNEAIFFGLSLRQFFFSVLACVATIGIYFWLKPYLGEETVGWVCVLAAFPFVLLGFVKYHGMPAEKFVWVFIKNKLLMPKRLVFRPENLYYNLVKNELKEKQKEEMNRHD